MQTKKIRASRLFSLNPKTGIVSAGGLKDASKRSAGRFAAFIPGAGVATKGREIKEKERGKRGKRGCRRGGRGKKRREERGKNQIFRWKDRYN